MMKKQNKTKQNKNKQKKKKTCSCDALTLNVPLFWVKKKKRSATYSGIYKLAWVVIPNGFYSERFYSEGLLFQSFFLSRKVVIPKIFSPKGHYSEDFYSEGSLFRRFFFLSRRVVIPKIFIPNLPSINGDDRSGLRLFLVEK